MSSKKLNPFKDFHSDQIQRSSRKIFTAHYACRNAALNLTPVTGTTNGFIFQIINSLIESWGVRLTWFDCNKGLTVIRFFLLECFLPLYMYFVEKKNWKWVPGCADEQPGTEEWRGEEWQLVVDLSQLSSSTFLKLRGFQRLFFSYRVPGSSWRSRVREARSTERKKLHNRLGSFIKP